MFILNILFVVSLYFVACLGMGGLLIYVFIGKKDNLIPSAGIGIATRFLLGQGLLANLWVFLSLPGHFSPLLVKGIIAILFIIGVALNYKLLVNAGKQFIGILREVLNEPWGWKFLILATLVIWLIWLPFWYPYWSSGTRFYLALPKVIAASGQLKVLPGYEEVASLGLQGEMHFAALMTMESPESTQLFSWLTLTAGCILLLALGRFAGLNRHGQWLSLAMVFTSSVVNALSGSGKTDVYGAAFAFAAYYWAFNIEKEKRIPASILTGLFGGLAVVAKISYIGSFLPSLAVIMIWKIFFQPNENAFSSKFLPLILVGISAVIIAIQLPIKNQILFNNPLAPYGMADIFGQVWYGSETIRKIYLTLPLALTFGGYWAQIGNITPLVLMFLPLLFSLPKPRDALNDPLFVLSIAAFLGLTCWFISHPSNFAPRYFLACLLLLILPFAKAAAFFASQGSTNTRLIQTAAILIISYTCLGYTTYLYDFGSNFKTITSGKPNCKVEPISCGIINNINPVLEPGTRIFTNTRFRYWLRSDLIQCAATTIEIENYLDLTSSELRWRFIIGRGFQSVVLENREAPLPETIISDLQNIPDWLVVTIVENNKDLIYLRMSPQNDFQPSLYDCNQIKPPAWDVFEITSP